MIRVVHPGSRILTFYPSRIPDPEVKKAPDPGSGPATGVTGDISEGQSYAKCSEFLFERFSLAEIVKKFFLDF
jgi:hypothetical protein